MVRVEVVATIACSPEEVLAFVMDIERYAEIDRHIHPVLWWHRDGDVVEFACRPKLAGLRQPKVIQQVRLTPSERIDISLSPRPANRLSHAMASFDASFACSPTDGGTRVTRTLEFRFRRSVRWLLEPLFRRRLAGEVRDEMRLAKNHLEAGHRVTT